MRDVVTLLFIFNKETKSLRAGQRRRMLGKRRGVPLRVMKTPMMKMRANRTWRLKIKANATT